MLRLRHRALDILTKSIQTISLRSVLIAAGDFNAQCVQQLPHVGPPIMHQLIGRRTQVSFNPSLRVMT